MNMENIVVYKSCIVTVLHFDESVGLRSGSAPDPAAESMDWLMFVGKFQVETDGSHGLD